MGNGRLDMDNEEERLIERLHVFWEVIGELIEKTDNKAYDPDILAPIKRYHWKFWRLCRLWKHSSPLLPMMKVLPHLHFPHNSLLDYYQSGSDMGSVPVLYVRKSTEPRLPNNAKTCLGDSMPKNNCILDAVCPEDTSDGAWELILLMELGDQFNLLWHAGTEMIKIVYDMKEFLAGRYFGKNMGHLFKVNNLSDDDKRELLSWDVSPKVIMQTKDGFALVDYCVFSPWGGFFHVQRKVQFKPELSLSKPLTMKRINYNCRFIF